MADEDGSFLPPAGKELLVGLARFFCIGLGAALIICALYWSAPDDRTTVQRVIAPATTPAVTGTTVPSEAPPATPTDRVTTTETFDGPDQSDPVSASAVEDPPAEVIGVFVAVGLLLIVVGLAIHRLKEISFGDKKLVLAIGDKDRVIQDLQTALKEAGEKIEHLTLQRHVLTTSLADAQSKLGDERVPTLEGVPIVRGSDAAGVGAAIDAGRVLDLIAKDETQPLRDLVPSDAFTFAHAVGTPDRRSPRVPPRPESQAKTADETLATINEAIAEASASLKASERLFKLRSGR